MNAKELLVHLLSSLQDVFRPTYHGHWPERHKSKAFWLMVNVTDLSRDFSPSIHTKYVTALYQDELTNVAAVNTDRRFYATFSQWGTLKDLRTYRTRMIASLGTLSSYSIQASPDETGNASTLYLNAHGNSNTIQITRNPIPVSFVNLPHLAVCMETLPGETCPCAKQYPIIKQFNVQSNEDIPERCVPIRLLPHCARYSDEKKHFQLFTPLIEMIEPEHYYEKTRKSKCYKYAPHIKWKKYTEFRNDL